MKNFVLALEDEFLPGVMELFKSVTEDDQDFVRFMAVGSCVSLCSRLSPEQVKERILPVTKKLATDNAWRVRYMAADRFCDVCIFDYLNRYLKSVYLFIFLVIKRIR